MELNQFAVYQLKNIPENRQIRFRPYQVLQEKGIQVWHENYEQVYLGKMRPEDTPETIRECFDRQLPRQFKGHSISVSDVFILNQKGVVTSYYVEKEGFTIVTGFIRKSPSGAAVSFETTGFHIEGKEGSWLTFDSMIIEGTEFFLMEHETYGKDAAWVVVDKTGKVIVDHAYHGFDQTVQQQIKDYLNPPQIVVESAGEEKAKFENQQKYMENREYLHNSEIDGEQNYNMIDGRRNSKSPKCRKGRVSVLAKLRQKQAEIAKRSGRPT